MMAKLVSSLTTIPERIIPMTRNVFLAAAIASTMAAPAMADGFTLTSPDIAEGQQLSSDFVFQGFGCEGGNTAPTLEWSGAPEGTESFAVTVYDPDAPTGSGWWHWFGSYSNRQARLPHNSAAIRVLPEPAKRSRTRSPRRLQSCSASRISATGFTVGCIARSASRAAPTAFAPA